MDPNSGRIYPSLQDALDAGVPDAVEITGTEESVQRISEAIKAQAKAKRKAQKKAQKKARKANR